MTVKGVADKLREYQGNQAAVARSFGVNRSQVTRFLDANPELREVKAEAEETVLDHAESALYRAMLAGEAWAVKWLLATKGKGRGYVERSEVTGKDGDGLIIKVVYVDSDSRPAAPAPGTAPDRPGGDAL